MPQDISDQHEIKPRRKMPVKSATAKIKTELSSSDSDVNNFQFHEIFLLNFRFHEFFFEF